MYLWRLQKGGLSEQKRECSFFHFINMLLTWAIRSLKPSNMSRKFWEGKIKNYSSMLEWNMSLLKHVQFDMDVILYLRHQRAGELEGSDDISTVPVLKDCLSKSSRENNWN